MEKRFVFRRHRKTAAEGAWSMTFGRQAMTPPLGFENYT